MQNVMSEHEVFLSHSGISLCGALPFGISIVCTDFFTAKMTEAKRPLHGSSCVLEVALLSVKIREGTLAVFARTLR